MRRQFVAELVELSHVASGGGGALRAVDGTEDGLGGAEAEAGRCGLADEEPLKRVEGGRGEGVEAGFDGLLDVTRGVGFRWIVLGHG